MGYQTCLMGGEISFKTYADKGYSPFESGFLSNEWRCRTFLISDKGKVMAELERFLAPKVEVKVYYPGQAKGRERE